jgi:hypothetical protein
MQASSPQSFLLHPSLATWPLIAGLDHSNNKCTRVAVRQHHGRLSSSGCGSADQGAGKRREEEGIALGVMIALMIAFAVRLALPF